MVLHLGHAAIDKQFRSGDVAAVVRRKKYHGLGDLSGRPEPPERIHAEMAQHISAVSAGIRKALPLNDVFEAVTQERAMTLNEEERTREFGVRLALPDHHRSLPCPDWS